MRAFLSEILKKMTENEAIQRANLKPFPKGYASGNHKQKGPYLTPLIKKFLEKKISFEDPETQKKIKGKVKDAIIWRLLLNAAQGENEAIKIILDRMDGKDVQKILAEGLGEHKITIIYPSGYKPEEKSVQRIRQGESIPSGIPV